MGSPTPVLSAAVLVLVRSGARAQRSGARAQRSGARAQRSGARAQRSGARAQRSGARARMRCYCGKSRHVIEPLDRSAIGRFHFSFTSKATRTPSH